MENLKKRNFIMKYLYYFTICYCFLLIIFDINYGEYIYLYILALLLILVSFIYELSVTKKIINKTTLLLYVGINSLLWRLGFNQIVVGFMAMIGLVFCVVLIFKKISMISKH